MNRKDFLKILWKKTIKPVIMIVLITIFLYNYKEIFEAGDVLAKIIFVIIMVYFLSEMMGSLKQKLLLTLPEKIQIMIKSLSGVFDKLLLLLTSFYIVYTIKDRSMMENVFSILMLSLIIGNMYFKQILQPQND